MEKQIQFKNHMGEKLAGTFHLPEKPTGRGVVMGHCFTCSRHTGILRQLGRDLADAGMIGLRFDFSGNGKSEGLFADATYSKQILEMETAAQVISDEGATWIGMAGHSMGAVISVLTASRSKMVKSVCALAGRLSGMDASRLLSEPERKEIHDTGRVTFSSRGRSLELTNAFFADADRFDLPYVIKSFETPLLVVHGDADEIVPVTEAYTAKKQNPDFIALEIVPRADHMFSNQDLRLQISRTVVEWFKKD